MTLIPVSIDPIVVEEILIGTIGAIASVVGAIAVMKAVPRAQGSPTKAEQRALSGPAGRLSMSVAAQAKASDPLNFRFTLPTPGITLLRIELANQLDKGGRNRPMRKRSTSKVCRDGGAQGRPTLV